MAAHRQELAAEVLVVPHHGSKTSSSPAFIEAVRPAYALYPSGYRNAYHFPHRRVVLRYRRHHVRQLNTARSGALEFRFGRTVSVPAAYREMHWRYWYSPWVDSR